MFPFLGSLHYTIIDETHGNSQNVHCTMYISVSRHLDHNVLIPDIQFLIFYHKVLILDTQVLILDHKSPSP